MLLELGSDIALRNRFFHPSSYMHPAKAHLGLIQFLVEKYSTPGETLADPMAGTGSLLLAATLQRNIILRELEPEWFALIQQNVEHIQQEGALFLGNIDIGIADAKQAWGYICDCIITSPPYGCSASTSRNGRMLKPKQQRLQGKQIALSERTQRELAYPTLGTSGSWSFHYGNEPQQVGHLRGKRYWTAMEQVYTQALTALRPSGYMVLILKDHILNGKRVLTSDMTITLWQQFGFSFVERHQRKMETFAMWTRRRKEAGLPIIEEEDIVVFRKA